MGQHVDTTSQFDRGLIDLGKASPFNGRQVLAQPAGLGPAGHGLMTITGGVAEMFIGTN